MNRLSNTHWVILAGTLVSVGSMANSFHSFAEMANPSFVFGVLGVLGTNIMAALTNSTPKVTP